MRVGARRLFAGPWVLAPLAAATLALLVAWTPPSGGPPRRHEVEMTMNQFRYAPNVLTVRRGDEVVIRLTTQDVTHGFYLDGYGINAHVEADETKEVRFVADRVGTFRFRCSVTCGALHPFMIGELVVEPNVPFAGATALVLATAAVAYLWSIRRRDAL